MLRTMQNEFAGGLGAESISESRFIRKKFKRVRTTIIDRKGNKTPLLLREGWKLLEDIRYFTSRSQRINRFTKKDFIKLCHYILRLPDEYEFLNIQEVDQYCLRVLNEQAATMRVSNDPLLKVKKVKGATTYDEFYEFEQ